MDAGYIGVENEFISFDRSGQTRILGIDHRANIVQYFDAFKQPSDFVRSSTSIRSRTGHAFYADGQELEMCTPPVAINKGFASRLTDLVMIGRDRVARSTDRLVHTGYSMHWNLTADGLLPKRRNRKEQRDGFYTGLQLPFMLFGANPLTTAINVRWKETESRVEVLGDHVPHEDQISATALLLGSYRAAYQLGGGCPLRMEHCERYSSMALDAYRFDRASPVGVTQRRGFLRKATTEQITVQEYLERFYAWISPVVKEFGTAEEVANLEGFIGGSKQLECDKPVLYARIEKEGRKLGGVHLPAEYTGMQLAQQKTRRLPAEGRLLGALARKDARLTDITWGAIRCYRDRIYGDRHVSIEGVAEIYAYCKGLRPGLPDPEVPLTCRAKPTGAWTLWNRRKSAQLITAARDADDASVIGAWPLSWLRTAFAGPYLMRRDL